MKNRPRLTDAAEVIRCHTRFLLTAHVRPDGDAIGSVLGLHLALQQLGKRPSMILDDECPHMYRFLPAWQDMLSPDKAEDDWEFEAAIVLDCDGLDRAGSVADLVSRLHPVVDIDHHTGRKAFGDVRAVYEDAAATAELVYELLQELGHAVTPDVAACLLAGLMFDTGSFRFANTSPGALRVAAELVEAGAVVEDIATALFAEEPFAKLTLRGIALSRAIRSCGGRICGSYLLRSDFEATGALPEHAEGIVEQLRGVAGVQVGVLSREVDSGEAKLSFRSRGWPDVGAVAAEFGGGGHREAAGATFCGSAQQALQAAISAIQLKMKGAP